jgi:hypothetical protein
MNQDRRIPRVIRDFTNQPGENRVLSFLSFEDWLARKETEAHDWIVVARAWKDETTDLFTFSVLASVASGNLEKLLSTIDWDVRLEFGKPNFYSSGEEKQVLYDPATSSLVKGIEFRPFVVYRDFHGFVPSTFELVQNFILYNEAFFVPELNEYRAIDDEGEIHSIARIKQEGNNRLIVVDAHHLRDYLAANQCYLVRYHDHRRKAVEDISKDINGQFASYPLSDQASRFDLWLRTDIPSLGYESASRLLGKDVVFPYPELDKRHVQLATGEKEDRFSTFIIERDEQGNDIESTCDEDTLSDYFADRGTPHFLTPVFFKREVLLKYYQEPSRFKIGDSDVRCLDLWLLPIDITEEELVQVWLGDLGRIRYKEQLHWRQFNVPPRGTITKHRWLRDFMAEFAEPSDDPIYNFRMAFKEVQREAKARYGDGIFRDLDEKDRPAFETLHLPITDEWKEFDEQVQALAKITVDSISVPLLMQQTSLKIDGETIKGSVDLLGGFLARIGIETATQRQITDALRAVQTLRSTGAAHRKGSNFEEALRRSQLDNLSNRAKVKKMVVDLTRALSILAEIVHRKDTI